jgi:hypothetical protein
VAIANSTVLSTILMPGFLDPVVALETAKSRLA